MTQLRDQLQSLQREYASARYPGNLADELLAPRRSPMRIAGWMTVATGIAAAILISLLHTRAITQPRPPVPPTVIVSADPVEDTTVLASTELASLPSFPDDLPLSPSAEAMEIGSMPSFPSLDLSFENETENTSTTKESV